MLGRVHLDESSSVPLYRQLHEKLAGMIRRGSLAHGERLPPTRELASQFGLNRNTVSAAYGLLEEEGLIRGHVGRGSFVHFEGPLEIPSSDERISFESSRPDSSQFPLDEVQETCREVLAAQDARNILQLGSPAGYGPLRRYLMDQAKEEGCARPGDDLLVTSGCQQALDLLQRVLAPSGTTVVVEDPVYHGLKNVFERSGVRLIGIGVNDDGIDLEQLARVCAVERPRLVIVTPDFQNPTGVSMPIRSREAITGIAREFHATIIENDIYRELRYSGEAAPSIKQLDESGSTILIRSFSKVAFPGLRVGWVTAPARVIGELVQARQWCDLHTDHLSQAIMLRFAQSGRLATHIRRMRNAGRERLKAVLQACERYLPDGSEFTRPDGGMNLWVRLPQGMDATQLLTRAEREGVSFVPGWQFGVMHRDAETLRLSFGGLSPQQIYEGLAILARIAKEEFQRLESGSPLDPAPAVV